MKELFLFILLLWSLDSIVHWLGTLLRSTVRYFFKPKPAYVYVPLYPEPPKGKRKIRWSERAVIREILRLHARGKFPSLEYVAREEPELLEAGRNYFGPWENALVAAGLICSRPEPGMFYDHEIGLWAHDSLTEPVNRRSFPV